ncbi:MAG: NTP transferase domain-containing protein [Bacteroidales bacterium]|nr:NTP transferase domain-containing protein [Bacteroidales bacterium]
MKAMIFAAGLGTRLGEISREKPKALVDVNGKTALRLAAEKLGAAGFEDLIVNIHHHPALMMEEIERLRSDGFRITISDETAELLDTGGGLLNARHFFSSEPFLCYNVDIFTDLNISDIYNSTLPPEHWRHWLSGTGRGTGSSWLIKQAGYGAGVTWQQRRR